MNLNELNEKIIEWAKERGFENGATIEGQTIKVIEECAELIQGISKDNIEIIKDSIGDVYVALLVRQAIASHEIVYKETKYCDKVFYTKMNILKRLCGSLNNIASGTQRGYAIELIEILEDVAYKYDLSLLDCIEYAYNEIKDRKGKMIRGTFVKEEDLK